MFSGAEERAGPGCSWPYRRQKPHFTPQRASTHEVYFI